MNAKNHRHGMPEFGATYLIAKQTRPLIYLAGAKLLTVFCYFLPFVCIVLQIVYESNASFGNEDNDDDGDNDNIDAVNNTSTDQIFNDLVILLLTRLALGTIAILVVRHNVNYSLIVFILPAFTALAAVLLIPLLDLKHFFTVLTFKVYFLMIIYVALSLLFDVIGHRAAFNLQLDLMSAPTVISVTFATFIEHLVDIAIVVVYLHDWISAKLIVTPLAIILLSIWFQRLATPSEQENNLNFKLQVL